MLAGSHTEPRGSLFLFFTKVLTAFELGPYLKINLKLKLQKEKIILVSACELIRGVLVLQDKSMRMSAISP